MSKRPRTRLLANQSVIDQLDEALRATVEEKEVAASNRIICGDALTELRALPDESMHCCVTSPPYWGLRDYGASGQSGIEDTPEEYVAKMVVVFREVWRVMRGDGTLWLNLGDSYNAYNGNRGKSKGANKNHIEIQPALPSGRGLSCRSLKNKDLVGIPWRVAFALQSDGWYLRQDIVWAKPNPMPESVRDRCTRAHEYVFLFSKSARYHFDASAIREPSVTSGKARGGTRAFRGQGRERDGAGTTGVVAVETGRRYVGIELNPAYVEMAAARLTTAANRRASDQLKLFNQEDPDARK